MVKQHKIDESDDLYVLASDYGRDIALACKGHRETKAKLEALKTERDLLFLAVSSVGGDLDLLLKSAPGGLPSTRQMEKWRDELADAWQRSKGGDDE